MRLAMDKGKRVGKKMDHSNGSVEPSASTKCQRCGSEVMKEKCPFVSHKKRITYFCDNCFKAVFKFDENMKTINQLWEENGRRFPLVVRSNNWHRSSYMVIKDFKNQESESGKRKTAYIGDMYLRGTLKEQDRPVGKANHFIWFRWSEELAQKYREEPKPEMGS